MSLLSYLDLFLLIFFKCFYLDDNIEKSEYFIQTFVIPFFFLNNKSSVILVHYITATNN